MSAATAASCASSSAATAIHSSSPAQRKQSCSGLVVGREIAERAGHLAEQIEPGHRLGGGLEPGRELREVDVGASARALAADQRGEDGNGAVQAGVRVRVGLLHAQRLLAGIAAERVEPAEGGDRRGVTAQLAQRALLAAPGHREHHEVRPALAQRLVAEAVTIEHARREVLDRHVAVRGEVEQQVAPGVGGEVDAEAELAAVDVVEHRLLLGVRCVLHDRRGLPHVVEALARLDLDHLGAEEGEHLAGDGPGPDPAEVEHAHTLQQHQCASGAGGTGPGGARSASTKR